MASKDQMLLVAQLLFRDGMKNAEIAKELKEVWGYEISTKNSRSVQLLIEETGRWLLREYDRLQTLETARLSGSVLADQVRETYGLVDVELVPGGETETESQYAELTRHYAQQAALYFERDATEAEEKKTPLHVAIAGGQTIMDMVSALPERRRTNVHFYAAAMLGRGSMNWTTHVGPETTATIAWARSGRIPKHLFYSTVSPYDIAPEHLRGEPRQALHEWVRSEIVKQVARQSASREVKGVMEMLNENINMAIAGLSITRATGQDAEFGEAHVERITMTNLLKPLKIDLKALTDEGAVGDLSYCLFDRKGICDPKWNFFLTAGAGTKHSGVNFYRNMVKNGQKVIVMAGMRQWDALLPALETKMFNVLVSDELTARRLMTPHNPAYILEDTSNGLRPVRRVRSIKEVYRRPSKVQ